MDNQIKLHYDIVDKLFSMHSDYFLLYSTIKKESARNTDSGKVSMITDKHLSDTLLWSRRKVSNLRRKLQKEGIINEWKPLYIIF